MRKLVYLAMLVGATVCGQSQIAWTNKTVAAPIRPTNGGYGSLANSFDSLSGQFVAYVQWRFVGTVSVTNGSPTVTWVSGDPFSIVWHNPNKIAINGTNVTVASGTIPGSCGSIPISCTTLTMSTNWAGSSGTFGYVSQVDGSIYNDCIAYYASSTNTWTRSAQCWGSLDNQLFPDNSAYGLPGMRQNNGMLAVDSNRHRFYLMGGVMENYQLSNVSTNGTSTVTLTTLANGNFVQAGGLWNGMTVGFPETTPTTKCTITSVTDESHMTVGSCTSGFPNGSVTLQLYPAEFNIPSGQANTIYDLWYLQLNTSPALNAFVQVFPTWNVNMDLHNNEPMGYDPDDDLLLYYNINTPLTWVFCSADGNPGGTLTSKQTAAGCISTNQWASVTTTGTSPGAVYDASVVYDHNYLAFWEYGGGVGFPQVKETDVYKYIPATKTWSKQNSISQPAATTNNKQFMSEVTLDTAADVLIYHLPDLPADYSWSPATNTWTTMTTSGSSPAGAQFMGYDPTTNRVVEVSNGSPYSVWQGAITDLSVPLTVQEALYCGDLTGHLCPPSAAAGGITRTNDSFYTVVPIADTSNLTGTSTLGLTGATAGQFASLETWPDGNIKRLGVKGTMASFTAGSTPTVTLVNSGSGNFGTPATMTSVAGGTITVNTTGGTGGTCGICFTLLAGANFDNLDTVQIGATTVVSAGTSTGLVWMGPPFPNTTCGTATACTTAYTSANDTGSTATVSYDGPTEALVIATGTLKDSSGNSSGITYSIYYYFHNNSANVRAVVRVINAQLGTSGTFATAWKQGQALELRLGSNLGSGTNSFDIGNHTGVGSPTTGTLTGSQYAYVYQGLNTTFIDSTWGLCGNPCTALTRDPGYAINFNGSNVQTGTNAQCPVGYADLSNSSNVGINIGSFLLCGSGPKSLEFRAGGNGTDAVRIGLFSAVNTFPVTLSWPQYHTDEVYYSFRVAAPSSIPNLFLQQQHDLIARPSVAQYNSSGVNQYPLSTATEEDTYYYSTVTGASPTVTTASGCAGGASYLTLGCIYDVGTQTSSQWPLFYYGPTGYTWEQGGGRDQIDWRADWLWQWIVRGYSGRWLQVKQFEMMEGDVLMPHSAFAGGWRGQSLAILDTTGRPTATSTEPSGTCDTDATGLILTLDTGAYFQPWYQNAGSGAMIVNGVQKTISSVTDPSHLVLSSAAAGSPLSGVACAYAEIGSNYLRNWSNANGADSAHQQTQAIIDYWEQTGDQPVYDALRNMFDDYQLNLATLQGAAATAQANGLGNTSTTTLTITSGSLPAYVGDGWPIMIGSTSSNFAAYIINNISGSTVTLASSAPTISGATWYILSGTISARAIGLAMYNAAHYSEFLTSIADSSDATTALTQAENVYQMQVKPALCVSGYPTSCVYGSAAAGPWKSAGVSQTRGVMYQAYNLGVDNRLNVTTGTALINSTALTVGSASGIVNGLVVTGTGIAPGTTVASISGTSVTLSQNTTAALTGTTVSFSFCTTAGPDERFQSPFQAAIFNEGLWKLRGVAGSSWSDYTNVLDLVSGGSLWSFTEASNYDGTSSWTNNGFRYYLGLDVTNCSADTTFYPVRSNQSLWLHPYWIGQYYGTTFNWKPFIAQSIARFMSSNSVGIGLTGQSIDVGGKQLSSVIYQINHGTTSALQTQTITGFVDNGGGSYTISWVTPQGTTSFRGKWGLLNVVDWVGYDPVANNFSATPCAVAAFPITCSGDATTTQPWFASTEITGLPTPLPGTQSITVATGTTGLISSNFMVKATAQSSSTAGGVGMFGPSKSFGPTTAH